MGIELIIRPFLAPDVTPPKRVPTGLAVKQPDPVKIEIGKDGGSPKTLSTNFSETITIYADKKPKEF